MKFLCDVHIPLRLSKHIAQLGFKCEHINNILDGYHTKDTDIAKFSDDNRMVLITKDRDFRNSFLLNRTPARLIKVNLGNVANEVLIALIENNIQRFEHLYNEHDAFMIELETDGTLTVTK